MAYDFNGMPSAGARLARFTAPSAAGIADRLSDLPATRPNPGKLRGRFYTPPGLPPGAPLVVVLHGCTQTAAAYDQGSGWSKLADRHHFALLFPEQRHENNPQMCFNWFAADDTQRGKGEPASIKAMIDAICETYAIDRSRIFVTGLSAGGAMASVMLATYPELFAAGAIIAGLPYGCASGVAQAFDCMGGRTHADAAALGARIRRASPHKGPWPRVSVWQGSADAVVVPSNGDAIVDQWLSVHGLADTAAAEETVDGYPHRSWTGADGAELVEHYEVTGMAHGVPLRPGEGEGELGAAGAHMLDMGVNSTARIAAFFGIAPKMESTAPPKDKKGHTLPAKQAARHRARPQPKPEPADTIQSTIENALRAAGLMR